MSITLSAKEHTCRKQRECDWCGEPIEVGERYYLWTGKVDGEFRNNPMHLECRDVYGALDMREMEEGFFPGEHKRGSLEAR